MVAPKRSTNQGRGRSRATPAPVVASADVSTHVEPSENAQEQIPAVPCPVCGAGTILHDSNGAKAGMRHCNACGNCYVEDMDGVLTPRDGHPVYDPSLRVL